MKYSKEFKEEALKMSDEIGVKKTSEQLGIEYQTIADWRKKRKSGVNKAETTMTNEAAMARIRELERENAELTKSNEILKDALGFFAKDRKK